MQTIEEIRRQFPILEREVNRRRLVYLDNTATSQTPECVVQEIVNGYTRHKANVHRGVHTLSQEATDLQESARRHIARWMGAGSEQEVIFTRGTTEALNLVASSYGGSVLRSPEEELVLTVMEHHANIVPWQLLQERHPFTLKVCPILENGLLDMDRMKKLIGPKTRIVSVAHASNVLGTVNPVKEIARMAHAVGATVVVDGAQAVPHMRVDVSDLDADFYAFSGHKMYGPAGVGVLYGRRKLLERMPPYQGGGEMIAKVTFEHTTFADLPYKFEAGTPDFIGIAALGKAVEWLENEGVESIAEHEHSLLKYAMERIEAVLPGQIDVYGTAPDKCAILSFNLRGAHHYDVGMLLDKQGVAVRTGHHCAQPLMDYLGIEGCVRASFAAYNTRAEVDAFIAALQRAAAILTR